MMRCMRYFLLLIFIGCGGTVVGGGDASTNKDATTTDGPIAADASAIDCTGLLAKINARRNELKVCCPFCQQPQCGQVTQDVCCPFSTTASNTTDFDGMVAQYKQMCHPVCPGTPCMMVPTNACPPNMMNPMQMGMCL
jgi:hypothetical protein